MAPKIIAPALGHTGSGCDHNKPAKIPLTTPRLVAFPCLIPSRIIHINAPAAAAFELPSMHARYQVHCDSTSGVETKPSNHQKSGSNQRHH